MTTIAKLTDASDLLGDLREVVRAQLGELIGHIFQSQNRGHEVPNANSEVPITLDSRLVGTMSQAIASAVMRKLATIEVRLCGFCGSPIEDGVEHRQCAERGERDLAVSTLELIGRAIQTAFLERCLLITASAAKPIEEIDTLIACYQSFPGDLSHLHTVLDDSNWEAEHLADVTEISERIGDLVAAALGRMLLSLSPEQRMSLAVVCDCGCTPGRTSKIPKYEWERSLNRALSELPSRRHAPIQTTKET